MNHLEATSPETDTPDEARRAPVTDGILPQTQLVCKVQEFAFFASRVGWYQRSMAFAGDGRLELQPWLIGESIREARDIRKSRTETKKDCPCFALNTKTPGTRALLGAMLNRRRITKYRSSERMSRLRSQVNPNGLELLQL